MSDDQTTNDGDQEEQTPTTEQAQPATEAQPPTNNVPGDGQQPVEPQDRVFTQADLDRLVPERGKRFVKSLLDELGFKSKKDLEVAVNKAKELEEAQKTELQRAQDQAASAEQARDEALKQANERLIRAAFMAEAGKVQAQHPQDAYLLANLENVSITDDGQVTGVEDEVEAMVESGRLPVAGKPKPPNLDGGAGSGERQQDKPLQLSQEEIEMARKIGVSPEDYQKNK